MQSKKNENRKKTRFLPEPGTYALLDARVSDKEESFKPEITALLINESFTGCALVIMGNRRLKEGQLCRIKLGYLLKPMWAEVRWRKELYNGIARVGLKYIE